MDIVCRIDDDEGDRGNPEPDHDRSAVWAAQTVRTHAVQCARCGKYRVIPDKSHYENIREHVHEQPWVCEDAIQWNSLACCEAPDEITGNSTFILTADRAGIPATPAGWERTVHIRAGPSNGTFSNVFYFAPPGLLSRTEQRMRSYQDIKRAVKKFPALLNDSVDISKQFSFAAPAPPAKYRVSARSHGASPNRYQLKKKGRDGSDFHALDVGNKGIIPTICSNLKKKGQTSSPSHNTPKDTD